METFFEIDFVVEAIVFGKMNFFHQVLVMKFNLRALAFAQNLPARVDNRTSRIIA